MGLARYISKRMVKNIGNYLDKLYEEWVLTRDSTVEAFAVRDS